MNTTAGRIPSATDVNAWAAKFPTDRLTLAQNHPNPFGPETAIRFVVPASGRLTTLRIFDVAGREVVRPRDRTPVAGPQSVIWNGRDAAGNEVASGVYFYRVEAGDEAESKKLLLLR